MGDCLQTGEPLRFITNTKVNPNPVFHSSGVCKLSTGLPGWSYTSLRHHTIEWSWVRVHVYFS